MSGIPASAMRELRHGFECDCGYMAPCDDHREAYFVETVREFLSCNLNRGLWFTPAGVANGTGIGSPVTALLTVLDADRGAYETRVDWTTCTWEYRRRPATDDWCRPCDRSADECVCAVPCVCGKVEL